VGWHPIGNPFILLVNVAALEFNGDNFATAVDGDLIESVLYKWVKGNSATFTTDVGGDTDTIEAVAAELDTASLPTELNAEFTANGLPLTSPTVEVVSTGSDWRIHDGDTFYDVTYNGNSFKINQKPISTKR